MKVLIAAAMSAVTTLMVSQYIDFLKSEVDYLRKENDRRATDSYRMGWVDGQEISQKVAQNQITVDDFFKTA
jgi:hypothetical protein